jgi:hypothetical protein
MQLLPSSRCQKQSQAVQLLAAGTIPSDAGQNRACNRFQRDASANCVTHDALI